MKTFIFLMTILVLYSCRTKECTQNFSFEFPLSVTPQDTFEVGDTIWFEMRSNQDVLDVYSGEYYDLAFLDLYFTFIMQKLDTNYIFNPIGFFSLHLVEGNFSSQGSTLGEYQINPIQEDSINFKFGLVPTKRGKFEIEFSLPLEIYYLETGEYRNKRLTITNSSCNQYMFPYSSVVVNNGATNRHLRDSNKCYQFSPTDTTTSCIGNDEVPLSGRGTFAFVVK